MTWGDRPDGMKPRKLGRNQKAVLRCLAQHGSWHSHCGWTWATYSGTVEVLDSLARRGLVTKTDEPMEWNNRPVTRTVYRLAVATMGQHDQDEVSRIEFLMDLKPEPLPPDPGQEVVGWMRPCGRGGSVKGKHHRCRDCEPTKPTHPADWEPVTRSRLAATMPCVMCGITLEKVRVP